MSYPRISASWETIGKIKRIAEEHDCFRDDDNTMPCVGELLYQIAEGDLVVINACHLAHLEAIEKKFYRK